MVTTQYYPNARPALAFSAKRDVMRRELPTVQPHLPSSVRAASDSVKFGATAFYKGPFENVKVITDYGVGKTEETSNNEIIDRFNRVLEFATKEIEQNKPTGLSRLFKSNGTQLSGLALEPWGVNNTHEAGSLPVNSISDIPGGNTEFAALSLVRLGGAERNKNIFIHVVDPGVGVTSQDHDRTILVTQNHGIYIGPNNGSLGLLNKRLQALGEHPRLLQIDFDKVQNFERRRLNNAAYTIPVTIHGRDVFAVVGGLIAAGVKPEALALEDHNGPKVIQPQNAHFDGAAELPSHRDEEKTVYAIQDKTFGNLKLNVPYSDKDFADLLKSNKQFQVKGPRSSEWHTVPVKTKFSDVSQGGLLLYHGSSTGVRPETRNLEIAANLDYASRKLGVGPTQAEPIQVRIR